MTNKAAALRYARALFDVAVKEGDDLQQVEDQLAGFAGLFSEHPALARVLLNPVVPVQRKRAAVSELAREQALQPVVRKLVELLAERDRLVLLPDLLEAYRGRLLDHRNVVRAEVTTAAELSPARMEDISRRLAEVTGRTVTLSTRVDPAILGGVVARIGSMVYDGSVTRQLEKIRNRLTEN